MKGEDKGSQVWAHALTIPVLRSLGHEDSEPEVSLASQIEASLGYVCG